MIEIEYVWHLEMIRIGPSQHSKTTAPVAEKPKYFPQNRH